MSVFDGLGLENVKVEQTNALPDGQYVGFVSEAKIVTKKDGNLALVLTYTVRDDENQHNGEKQVEWRTFPRMIDVDGVQRYAEEKDERDARFLKMRLISLGIKEDEIPGLDVTDIQGTPVKFTVRTNNGYKNIRWVETISANGGSSILDSI
jgi:hypothetical protein